MEIASYNIMLKHKGEFLFIEPLGDLHIGNPAFDVNHFKSRVKAIAKDPNRYWFGMGDYIDNIHPWRRGTPDKRFTYHAVGKRLLTPGEQAQIFRQLIAPIRGKCLGLLWGNHEDSLLEPEEFISLFCEPDLRFLGYEAMVRLRIHFRKKHIRDFVIWMCHGAYAGMKSGGAISRLEDLSRKYDAQIFLHAHTHSKGAWHGVRYQVDWKNRTLQKLDLMYVLTGCFLQEHVIGYHSYTEAKPTTKTIRVGTITIGLDPWTGKVHVYD